MAYFFPSNHREIFPRTFLKDVYISFFFPETGQNQVDEDSLRALYAGTFGLDYGDGKKVPESMEVRSQDELVKFVFDNRQVSLKMKFPAYKSFDFALRWLPVMCDYMASLGVDNVSRIEVGKYNELQYQLPAGGVVSSAMKEIFSARLLGYGMESSASFDEESSKFDGLARWEKRVVVADDDGTSQLTIEYGFSEKDKQQNSGVLTLKTYMESTCKETAVGELRERVKDYNAVLDNAFMWCVGDGIISKMRAK